MVPYGTIQQLSTEYLLTYLLEYIPCTYLTNTRTVHGSAQDSVRSDCVEVSTYVDKIGMLYPVRRPCIFFSERSRSNTALQTPQQPSQGSPTFFLLVSMSIR